MKDFQLLILFIIGFFLSTSCSDDGLKLFDKDVTMSKSHNVSVPENSPVRSITLSNTFDGTTEAGLKNIVERVDEYTINSVTYSIENYSGEPTNLEKGIIQIESTGGELLAVTTLTNVDIQALDGMGEQVLVFDPVEINTVEQAFLNDSKINFIISATIDNMPVSFTLTTKINFTVEYRVLD